MTSDPTHPLPWNLWVTSIQRMTSATPAYINWEKAEGREVYNRSEKSPPPWIRILRNWERVISFFEEEKLVVAVIFHLIPVRLFYINYQ
jgi:hypothetical protein